MPFDLQRKDGASAPAVSIASCGEVTQVGTKLPTYVAPSTETGVSSAEYEIGFDLVPAAKLAEFQLSSNLLLIKLRVLPLGKQITKRRNIVDSPFHFTLRVHQRIIPLDVR